MAFFGFKPNSYGSSKNRRFLSGLENEHSDPFVVREGKFSYGQLKDSYYYSDWTEHSFLSDAGDKKIVGRTFSFNKIFYIRVILLLLFSILLFRAAWLQIINGDYYYSLAEGNRLRVEIVEPRRGIIYDKNLTPLVRNTANFVLYLRPIDLPKSELERDGIIRQIAQILDNESALNNLNKVNTAENVGGLSLISDSPSYFKIKTLLDEVVIGSLESYQPLFIADNIEYNKAMLLSLNLNNLPGVFLSNKIRREYLFPVIDEKKGDKALSLSHILGYTGKISEKELEKLGDDYSVIDYVGKNGLEYFWERDLKGVVVEKILKSMPWVVKRKLLMKCPLRMGITCV